MWTQSVCSSVIAASLASNFLKEGGILQLTGAKAALDATPGMIGYGNTFFLTLNLVNSIKYKIVFKMSELNLR